jgi:hypothetical protein
MNIAIDRLKPLALTRLYSEITDPTSNNAMRAIEIAGRFKETDWFVRHSETNVGIFATLIESPIETVDLDKYRD